ARRDDPAAQRGAGVRARAARCAHAAHHRSAPDQGAGPSHPARSRRRAGWFGGARASDRGESPRADEGRHYAAGRLAATIGTTEKAPESGAFLFVPRGSPALLFLGEQQANVVQYGGAALPE